MKSQSISSILVIGNNHISSSILQALTTEPRYTVSLLTHPSHTPFLSRKTDPVLVKHYKVKLSDFAALTAAFKGQDLVISTGSGGDFELQARIIDAAIAAGVARFIPAEFGHDSRNERVQERLPPSKQRALVIEYLQSKAIEGDIEWTALAVGVLLDERLRSGDLGFELAWQSATVHGTGDEHFAATSFERVGVAVASILLRWEDVKDRYLYCSGCSVTANEIVRALEKVTGKEWTVGYHEVAECVREGKSRIEKGFPDAGMFLMERSVLYDEELGAFEAFEREDAKRSLGLKEEVLEEMVKGVVHQFKHYGKGDCGCG